MHNAAFKHMFLNPLFITPLKKLFLTLLVSICFLILGMHTSTPFNDLGKSFDMKIIIDDPQLFYLANDLHFIQGI